MKPSLKMITSAIIFGSFAFYSNVYALDGGALYKNPVKGGCTACHGKDGKKTLMPSYPKLAGQNADYLYNQLKDIQSGARNNGQTAAMKGVMHMTTDEEKRSIADWLATQ